MVHVCAAFGPKGSYLFSTDTQWRCKDVPREILTLFSGATRAKEIYEVALGPNGSYAVTFADQSGVQKFMHDGISDDLKEWVCGPGRDLESLNIALGPNGAFFAFDATAAIWDELPEHFEQQVNSLISPVGGWKYGKNPISVSFGPNGSYVLIVEDGCASFVLDDDYPAAIKKYLLKNQLFALKNKCIILNPSSIGTYMILDGEGEAEGAFPSDCVAHFRAFADEWKVICKNVQIDATNEILKGTGLNIPRLSVAPSPQSVNPRPTQVHQSQNHANPQPYRPQNQHPPRPSHAPNAHAQQDIPDEAPPPYTAHNFSHNTQPPSSPLHHASNSNTSKPPGAGSGSSSSSNSNPGVTNTANLINNLVNASNSNSSSSGSSGSAPFNPYSSASNPNTELYTQLLNAMTNGGGGGGGGGVNPNLYPQPSPFPSPSPSPFGAGPSTSQDIYTQLLNSYMSGSTPGGAGGGDANAEMINQILMNSAGAGGGGGVPVDPTGGVADLAATLMGTMFF